MQDCQHVQATPEIREAGEKRLPAERFDFARYFGDNRIAFDGTWDSVLQLRVFARQHDFEALGFSIAKHTDVNADNSRTSHQFFVMVGEDCVDVPPFPRGLF